MGSRTMMEQASQSPDVPSTTDPRGHTVRKECWNSIHHVHIHMHTWGWRVRKGHTCSTHMHTRTFGVVFCIEGIRDERQEERFANAAEHP